MEKLITTTRIGLRIFLFYFACIALNPNELAAAAVPGTVAAPRKGKGITAAPAAMPPPPAPGKGKGITAAPAAMPPPPAPTKSIYEQIYIATGLLGHRLETTGGGFFGALQTSLNLYKDRAVKVKRTGFLVGSTESQEKASGVAKYFSELHLKDTNATISQNHLDRLGLRPLSPDIANAATLIENRKRFQNQFSLLATSLLPSVFAFGHLDEEAAKELRALIFFINFGLLQLYQMEQAWRGDVLNQVKLLFWDAVGSVVSSLTKDLSSLSLPVKLQSLRAETIGEVARLRENGSILAAIEVAQSSAFFVAEACNETWPMNPLVGWIHQKEWFESMCRLCYGDKNMNVIRLGERERLSILLDMVSIGRLMEEKRISPKPDSFWDYDRAASDLSSLRELEWKEDASGHPVNSPPLVNRINSCMLESFGFLMLFFWQNVPRLEDLGGSAGILTHFHQVETFFKEITTPARIEEIGRLHEWMKLFYENSLSEVSAGLDLDPLLGFFRGEFPGTPEANGLLEVLFRSMSDVLGVSLSTVKTTMETYFFKYLIDAIRHSVFLLNALKSILEILAKKQTAQEKMLEINRGLEWRCGSFGFKKADAEEKLERNGVEVLIRKFEMRQTSEMHPAKVITEQVIRAIGDAVKCLNRIKKVVPLPPNMQDLLHLFKREVSQLKRINSQWNMVEQNVLYLYRVFMLINELREAKKREKPERELLQSYYINMIRQIICEGLNNLKEFVDVSRVFAEDHKKNILKLQIERLIRRSNAIPDAPGSGTPEIDKILKGLNKIMQSMNTLTEKKRQLELALEEYAKIIVSNPDALAELERECDNLGNSGNPCNSLQAVLDIAKVNKLVKDGEKIKKNLPGQKYLQLISGAGRPPYVVNGYGYLMFPLRNDSNDAP